MTENDLLKKDAVRMVKKRLYELLKPYGFSRHPKHKGLLCRVRGEFIDCMSFRTDGYHLELDCGLFLKIAPYVGVHADWYVVANALPERSPQIKWRECIVGEGPFYYKIDYFEQIWDDVVYAIKNCLLNSLENMDLEHFLPLFVYHDNKNMFKPDAIIDMGSLYFQGMIEAAVFGLGSWKQGNYENGLTYLMYAREKLALHLQGRSEGEFHVKEDKHILSYLNDVFSLWESKPKDWNEQISQCMELEAQEWISYIH